MNRKALSPVIASVILAGMVLVIGAGVWSYSYSAASAMANDYADDTIEMVNSIIERFCIEKVHYDNTTETIELWVYNYGKIRLIADITVKIDGNSYETSDVSIASMELRYVSVDVSAELGLSSYDDVIIEIITERNNQEYMTYYVP